MKTGQRLMNDCLPVAVLCLIFSATGMTMVVQAQDGPVKVTYGDVYQKGELKIEPYDLTKLPSLPAGYAALNGKGYLITTTAIVSGPHVIRFNAFSVTDEDAFKNLRIFHAEPDTFDPESPAWVDRTVLLNEDAPAFSNRIVNSSSDKMGVFVIGTLVAKIPPSTAAADLVVTGTGSPNPVISPNKVTFTVKIANNGPQPANEVGVINSWSPDSLLVSASPSQGICKEKTGSLYCKLGTLAAGATTTIQVVVKPYEGAGSFPPEGKQLVNHAFAAAREGDTNRENNISLDYVHVFPDPNLPPQVSLEDPKMGDLFVGPAEIKIKATATDTDGTIKSVEFFDNGHSIGMGASTDGKHFQITERNVSFGSHNLWAVTTDDGGRQNSSGGAIIITVNGTANVTVTSPADGALIEPGSNLTLTARASHSGVISKVEFFANHQLLGEATLAAPDTYTFSWQKIQSTVYSIVAVVTDGGGVATTSTPIKIAVGRRPTVSIISPAEGFRFPLQQTNLSIRVKANQPGRSIAKVDFYANDQLIGTASDIATDQFLISWRNVREGAYSLTAIATDELGVTGKSPPVKIKIENQRGNNPQ